MYALCLRNFLPLPQLFQPMMPLANKAELLEKHKAMYYSTTATHYHTESSCSFINATCRQYIYKKSITLIVISLSSSFTRLSTYRLSTYGTRAFSVAGPVSWNSLLDYLKSSDLSFNCFRQQLKHF